MVATQLNDEPLAISDVSAGDGAAPALIASSRYDRHAWDAYVSSHPQATIYHTDAWRRVVAHTFDRELYYLAVRTTAEDIAGVIPLVRQKSMLFGDRLVSLPYCNYGGALYDSPDAGVAVEQAARDLGAKLGCDVVETRNHFSRADESQDCRSGKVRMLLDLPASIDELGVSLGSKRRSQIRRCEREAPDVRVGGAELVADFYTVFCENMRDLGTPVYPRRFFESVASELEGAVRIIVVSIDGEPAAAGFLIGYRHTLEIPWAASLRKHSRIAVNMKLYWEVLRFAIESGYTVFDFGRCTEGEGTYRFKKQWGSLAHPLYWESYDPKAGKNTSGDGESKIANLASRIWSRLPLSLANRIGPAITTNLPW